MSTIITASDGTQIDLDNTAQTFNYSGGFLTSIVITLNSKTFTQTFTNDGTNITNISNWVES